MSPSYFVSSRHAALGRRWLTLVSLAVLSVWWWEEDALFIVLGLLLLTPVLAVQGYSATRRRRFLALACLPALPLLATTPLVEDVTLVIAAGVIIAVAVPMIALSGLLHPQTIQRASVRAGAGLALAGTAIAVWGTLRPRHAATSWSAAQLAELAGCYRVERGMSVPTWRDVTSPPRLTRLDTVRWTEGDSVDGKRVSPIRHGNRKAFSVARGEVGAWRERADGGIDLWWDHAGLVGARLQLRRRGRDLAGRARWFQDVATPLPKPVMRVHLHRRTCAP